MLNRLFTGLFTGLEEARRLRNEAKLAADGALAEVTRLDAAVQAVSERLDELVSEHRKLRGRFYAARGELSPEAAAPPTTREAMKAQVLAKHGIVPGRPVQHTEKS